MSTVTKKELIERLAEQSGLKRQDVRQVVQGFLDEVINELGKGNRSRGARPPRARRRRARARRARSAESKDA